MAVRLILVLLLAAASLGSQGRDAIVFADAFLRTFTVTDCSNANPIVVTIQTPAADTPLAVIPLEDDILVTITGVTGNTACNVTNAVINQLTSTTFELTGVAGNGAYVSGGVGQTETIISAAASFPLPNIGQVGSLMAVDFPSQTSGSVTGVQVRLEAATNCPNPPTCSSANWFPISPDVDGATEHTNRVFNLVKANGAWRIFRVNSLVDVPDTNFPMAVDYTGSPTAFGTIIDYGDYFNLNNPQVVELDSLEFVAGACQSGTAALGFNGGTNADLPEATCVNSNTEMALANFDPTTDECVEDSFKLNSLVSNPPISAWVSWQSASGTGAVVWDMDYVCIEPGEAFDSAAYVAGSVTTATTIGAAQFTNTQLGVFLTTNCPGRSHFFFRLCRDANNAGDTLAADARLKSLTFE